MTTIQIVRELQKQGKQIKYRVRTDGGIVVQEVDGVKFTGTQGNTFVRTISGQALSTKQVTQRESITPKIKEAKQAEKESRKEITKLRKELASGKDVKRELVEATKKHKVAQQQVSIQEKKTKARRKGYEEFSDELLTQFKKTQKIWNKNIDTTKQGKITKRKVRYILQTKGEEAAKAALTKAENYAEGIAYIENVEQLVLRIQRIALGVDDGKTYKDGTTQGDLIKKKISNLSEAILAKASEFKEEWIAPCNELMYDLEKAFNNQEVTKTIKKICVITGISYDSL